MLDPYKVRVAQAGMPVEHTGKDAYATIASRLPGNRYSANASIFFFLYSVFYILYSIFYILYSVFCILYSIFYILYSVFYILYSIPYLSRGFRHLLNGCTGAAR